MITVLDWAIANKGMAYFYASSDDPSLEPGHR
jgi:hypothetical protein